ncbi:MAG: CHAT domain-containing protein [Ferruginibacter sp.]
MKKIALLFILLWLKADVAFSQNSPLLNNNNIYRIYEDQYSDLLKTRGVPNDDITNLLKNYGTNQLNSDSAFAHLLQQLYSRERGIGLLFYFFNNDTLRRAYFRPGELIEVKYIPIKRANLLQLGADINQSLNLYEMSENRSPQLRGNEVLFMPTRKITFKTAIKNATEILIPANFDLNTKHLLIVPALNIGTIPFHLLQPYKNQTHLIERCSFTIVPSLIDLVGLRTKVLKKENMGWDDGKLPSSFDGVSSFSLVDKKKFLFKNPLFVSNPVYPSDSFFVFPPLPGAEREINAVKQYAPKYVLLKGAEAHKVAVLKNLKTADVAYFATHGIADQDDPMGKSFLVLSGSSPYLTAKEIMGLRSSFTNLPELVILSACQTGLGKSMEAGTAGLARSFLLGGSMHVIMSLWNVDDDATAYLMSRFVYHLQTPHRFMPAEPLRLAVLDCKKIYKNPAQWASFSLIGIDY